MVFSTPQKHTPQKPPGPLENAIALHKNGKLQEAEAAYQALLQENPKNDAALYRMGVLRMQTGKLQDAQGFFQKAIEINPGEPDYQSAMATLAARAGNPNAAYKILAAALEKHPQHSGLHTNIGALLSQMNKFADAERHLLTAASFNAADAETFYNLGLLYLRQSRLDKAEFNLMQALHIRPDYANAWFNIGDVKKSQRRYSEALDAYHKCTDLDPGHAAAWVQLGTMLAAKNRIPESLDCLRRALEIDPHDALAYYQTSYMLYSLNRLGELPDLIEQAKENLPGAAITAYLEALYLRTKKEYDKALQVLKPFDADNSTVGMKIHYELGRIYDRLDDTENAFYHYTVANAIAATLREARVLDIDQIFKHMDELRETVTPDWLRTWTPPVKNRNHQTPVFLTGFPRSGTTLLDQILSAHPDIHVSAERSSLAPTLELIRKHNMKHPDCLPDLTPEFIELARNAYFEQHKSYGDWQDRPVFIDKMPLNIQLFPLIHRLFPNAKVIVALRHPCDCVLSNFMNEFTPNYATVNTNDLERCARLYDGTMRLYSLYQETMPFVPVHELRYEDLVADLKGEAEKILSFLELPWNDSVLEYYKKAREGKFISTPSAGQVTQKIYTDARHRWLRYREQLTPVLPILAPWAEKFGYSIKE